MKKLLLASTLLLAATSVNAGLFTSTVTSGWEDKAPEHKYKLNTYGYDVRVYEWTPKNNKNISCVFVAGETNSTGIACYPKKSKK